MSAAGGPLLGADIIATALQAYEEVERTARAELSAAVSSDPLCAWIVDHAMPSHHDEALTVLRRLPCIIDDLHRLAADNCWCEAWDEYVTAAREAGVIPGAAS